MSNASPEVLATGLYRTGMIALVAGFAAMYASAEGWSSSAEGWTLFVAGLIIAIHGAVAPLAEYGIGWYKDWNRSPLFVDSNR